MRISRTYDTLNRERLVTANLPEGFVLENLYEYVITLESLERRVKDDLWVSLGGKYVSMRGVLIGVGVPIGSFLVTCLVVWFGGLAIHRWFVVAFRDYEGEDKYEPLHSE